MRDMLLIKLKIYNNKKQFRVLSELLHKQKGYFENIKYYKIYIPF